jgi:hypothetical protein
LLPATKSLLARRRVRALLTHPSRQIMQITDNLPALPAARTAAAAAAFAQFRNG